MSSRKWSCWCAKAETVWQEQHPSMHFTCEWPFKDGGLQQAAKIWDRSRVDFDCGVLPIVRGCRSTSELHPVCCIRGLVFPTSRDCPCVQPAFILSWYSYTLRKTLCCGKESPKLTSRANHQRWNAYDDQCLDGPLLPRKELCWRTELSIELRQPLFNLSLNIILTFSACLSPSSWCVLLTAVVLPVWVGMLPLLLCLSTHAVLPCIGGVMATVHKVFDGW